DKRILSMTGETIDVIPDIYGRNTRVTAIKLLWRNTHIRTKFTDIVALVVIPAMENNLLPRNVRIVLTQEKSLIKSNDFTELFRRHAHVFPEKTLNRTQG